MGDPVYDDQKNVIRRDFGVKNIVAIMVVGFIGYSLMGETKPISGKGKMKGGAAPRPPKPGEYAGLGEFPLGWLFLAGGLVATTLWAIFYAVMGASNKKPKRK